MPRGARGSRPWCRRADWRSSTLAESRIVLAMCYELQNVLYGNDSIFQMVLCAEWKRVNTLEQLLTADMTWGHGVGASIGRRDFAGREWFR